MFNINELVKIEIKEIKKNTIIISEDAHKWCQRAYEGHPKGCPNYNNEKALNCPPHSLSFDKFWNVFNFYYLVHAKFNFKKYKEQKAKEWDKQEKKYTEKQLGNRRHWQGAIKSLLRKEITKILKLNPLGVYISSCGSGFDTKDMIKYQKGIFSMESLKINVISTVKLNKISIKRNPTDFMRFVCLLCHNNPLILPNEKDSIAKEFILKFKELIKDFHEIYILNSKINNKKGTSAYICLRYEKDPQLKLSHYDQLSNLENFIKSIIDILLKKYTFQYSIFEIHRDKDFTFKYYFKEIKDPSQENNFIKEDVKNPIKNVNSIERFL